MQEKSRLIGDRDELVLSCDLALDDRHGPSLVYNSRLGDDVTIERKNRPEEVDLHVQWGACATRWKRAQHSSGAGALGEARRRSAVDRPSKVVQPLRRSHRYRRFALRDRKSSEAEQLHHGRRILRALKVSKTFDPRCARPTLLCIDSLRCPQVRIWRFPYGFGHLRPRATRPVRLHGDRYRSGRAVREDPPLRVFEEGLRKTGRVARVEQSPTANDGLAFHGWRAQEIDQELRGGHADSRREIGQVRSARGSVSDERKRP